MLLRCRIKLQLLTLALVLAAGTSNAARTSLGPDLTSMRDNTILPSSQQHALHLRALQQATADSFMLQGEDVAGSNDSRRGRGRTSHSHEASTTSSVPSNMPASSAVPAEGADAVAAAARQPMMQQAVAAQQPTVQPPATLQQPSSSRPGASRQQSVLQHSAAVHKPGLTQHQQQLAGRQQLVQQPVAQQPAGRQQQLPRQSMMMQQPVYAHQPIMVQNPAMLQQPLYAQPGYAQLPLYAQQPVFDYSNQATGRRQPNAGALVPSQPQVVYVPVPVPAPAVAPVADAAPAKPEKLSRQEKEIGKLDFGLIPKLNLSSGLEDLQSGLSDLVKEFQGNGGFWNGKTLSENVVNAVQLGVKGGLKLAAPIVNGIASAVPIMVPSLNGKCINGKPVRPMKDNKGMIMCLVGTGAQVTDYITNAADMLAGMAGQVLVDNPQAAAAAAQQSAANGTASPVPVSAAPAAALNTAPATPAALNTAPATPAAPAAATAAPAAATAAPAAAA